MKVTTTLSPRDYDAVLFDLDGVLTRSASVHAVAWKKLFDGFLEPRATRAGEPFIPFDIGTDYSRYVDGKPRYDGVAAFLESRGIELPLGTFEDGPDVQSVRALGNLKDRYFLKHLEQHGIEPYEAAIALVRKLRAEEIKTAVVSSSNNCAAVLETAGIAQLFDTRVDGKDVTRLELKGKPAPDAYLEAARRIGVERSRAVVVEDAIVGVKAGHAGRFGCVIGVDRRGYAKALYDAGADVVVTDLGQVGVAVEPPSAWSLVFEGFDPAQEGIREALCTLGNGYFATRGAAAGAGADDIHYAGSYLAGGYNRLHTDIAGRVVENEDLVNFPNWLALEFRIAEEDWFDERTVKLLAYRQELNLRQGVLLRSISFEDGQGRRSTLKERRLVSMGDMHLGAMELTLTADNWSAGVTVRSAIDGRVVNVGAKLYRKFNHTHLEPLVGEAVGDDGVSLLMRTCQSNIQRLDLILEGENDNANRYKLSKQADVLMLFYLFSAEEICELFERLDYPFECETIPRNITYYTDRSSHGSTLCRVVHAWVLARSDRPRSMQFFAEALQSDVADIQQGTTAEGVHLGAMAGTVDLVQRAWTGIEVKGDVLRLHPELPQDIERLDMRIRYRGHSLDLRLTRDSLTIRGRDAAASPITLCVDGKLYEFVSGTTRVFRLTPSSVSRIV